MSERKVLNKYFPPDFDPSAIPRKRLGKNRQYKVRLMTPFSMRCNTCGDYIYKGKKFNARKETVEGEEYLGIKIFRFYIVCPRCSAEITFKTDPKNTDYVAEHGAQRNFEPWRDEAAADEEMKQERAEAEDNNPMKALENRTMESKREMDILDALDEIRTRNARSERANPDAVIDRLVKDDISLKMAFLKKQQEEDDALAKAIFQASNGEAVRRLNDDEEDPEVITKAVLESVKAPAWEASSSSSDKKPGASSSSSQPPLVKKSDLAMSALGIKRKAPSSSQAAQPAPATRTNALSALGSYGDDSDEDE